MVTGQDDLLVFGVKNKLTPLTKACHKWGEVFTATAPLTADTDLLFHHFLCHSVARLGDCWKHTRVLTRYAQQEVENNESINSPTMAFLAGTPKKRSNCQLLVSWWLLSVFVFRGVCDMVQIFPWHDRYNRVMPLFILNIWRWRWRKRSSLGQHIFMI